MSHSHASWASASATGSGRTGGPDGGGHRPPCTAVVGLQWGDEGKGKIIDLIAGGYRAVVRYNGGANAGHSVVIGGKRHALHLVPSGIFHPGVRAVIGNGVVVDPEALLKELDALAASGVDTSGLVLSDRAHVVLPYHKAEDALRETLLAAEDPDRPPAGPAPAAGGAAGRSIGTTRRGIGPAYADKASRSTSVRVGDLLRPPMLAEKILQACRFKQPMFSALGGDEGRLDPSALASAAGAWGERLRPYIADTVYLLHDLLRAGEPILFEGANATLLDVDHGTYPYVTSSHCSALGIPAGTGVPPRHIADVVGVLKAYSTRVGGGPFPTELVNATGDRIRERGREYGTTTGRPRRCGWLDLAAVRYSTMVNGCTGLAVMLLDVLAGFDELLVCTHYEIGGKRTDRFPPDAAALADARPVYERLPGFGEELTGHGGGRRAALPDNARRYVEFIERTVGVPVRYISVGPDRTQTIIE
ncbi:MAG: adenylosuccinate synthase [Phycisphaerales bacterium]|nr:adenylosuccinate synthase [Phycisphaerales bacterium]